MALIQYRARMEELDTTTDVLVILPTPRHARAEHESYRIRRKNERYQVFYLYHGTSGDCWSWTRYSSIERYADEHCLAIVMPNVQNSNFHNIPNGAAYEDYVAREVPRLMEWTFPISSRREDKFIAGLSMGGLGALKIALKNTQDYAAVASLSGDFMLPEMIEKDHAVPWASAYGQEEKLLNTPEDPYWLSSRVMEKHEDYPNIYLCCGTEDTLCRSCNQQMLRHMDQIGMKYTYHEQAGKHEWAFWDREIQRVMNWLPLKNGMVEE